MTQNVLENDLMVNNMTKNPKIYKKSFLVIVLENYNGEIENQQTSKITNAEKHRNIRKGRAIKLFVKHQRIRPGCLNINRNKYKT